MFTTFSPLIIFSSFEQSYNSSLGKRFSYHMFAKFMNTCVTEIRIIEQNNHDYCFLQ